jgi:hypothetical protein
MSHGSPDWLERCEPSFKEILRSDPEVDDTTPPADATAPGDPAVHRGVYGNEYFGDVTVPATGDSLTIFLGHDDVAFHLNPCDGDAFWSQLTGENGVNSSPVTFVVSDGAAVSVTDTFLYEYGLGTFVQSKRPPRHR